MCGHHRSLLRLGPEPPKTSETLGVAVGAGPEQCRHRCSIVLRNGSCMCGLPVYGWACPHLAGSRVHFAGCMVCSVCTLSQYLFVYCDQLNQSAVGSRVPHPFGLFQRCCWSTASSVVRALKVYWAAPVLHLIKQPPCTCGHHTAARCLQACRLLDSGNVHYGWLLTCLDSGSSHEQLPSHVRPIALPRTDLFGGERV